ncbi:hypothetical protein G9A89_000676 [Geosiphon pyriformis]|nr:hypothetical protein G9A89_000676 [Geosiphon pyriformis]
MPKCTHDTNARFDLRYPKKEAIKLEPKSCIYYSVIRGSSTSHKHELTALQHTLQELKRDQKPLVTFGALSRKQHSKNNFKVVTTPNTTTLEYYQSIYTHCKQRFNIPDGIEVIKKSVYQYIENCINNYLFGNYNISKVRSNLYNNLVYYSQLGTEDLNSETLATYFQELNFNIIEYCEEKYPVQSQYSIDFELETETSNKDKQELKQYSRTTPNTPILPKTTAKHLQTPEQRTSVKLPLSITPFPILLAQPQTPKNQSEHSETAIHNENNSESSEEEEESIHNESEEDEMMAYIAKIPEFNGENIETSPQEWLDQVTKAGDANGWNAARMLRTIPYFLKRTAGEWFKNLTTPFYDWTAFKTSFLEQFIDNNTSITLQNYFSNIKQEPSESVMTYIGKFNKLLRRICQLETNDYYSDAQILDQFIAGLKDKLIKKVCPHVPEDLNSAIQHAKRYEMAIEKANHTKLVNLAIGETSLAAEEKIDQLTKKNFYHTALSEGRAAAQQNPFYTSTTIPPARITENANLSDIFSFEFEANKLPFLLSNAAANKQKAITAMYTKAEVEGKAIHLILNSGSAGSIITYQLMQQLKRNVNQSAQTVIITADDMKKTLIGEIDNFLFTLDGITISVKVLVMNAPQYQALLTIFYQGQHVWISATCSTFNKCFEKASAFEFEPEEEKPIIETFMALGSTSNWADETEQQYFLTNNPLKTKKPVTPRWNVPYLKPKPWKQCSYIPLKYKDYHKKLLSIGACILPEEEYKNHTCHLIKRSGKWNNTLCLTCGNILPEEYNWIDVAMRGGVCDQTCQYALSISEKVKRGTPFDAAYNSALNKLYHYPHNAEMIFDLAMALINGATQKNVCQMKESEYIVYIFEIAGYNYKDEIEVYYQIVSHTYLTKKAQA